MNQAKLNLDVRIRLGEQLRATRVRRGWSIKFLAEKAGISRSTIFNLESGAVAPHGSTLERLAQALGHTTDYFLEPDRGDWDQATNRVLDDVAREHPEVLAGLNRDDREELASLFGHGGPLTEAGVRHEADRLRRRRQTLEKLAVVLETHLGKVAETMIDELFAAISAGQPNERSKTQVG